jgi:hypothetical protein
LNLREDVENSGGGWPKSSDECVYVDRSCQHLGSEFGEPFLIESTFGEHEDTRITGEVTHSTAEFEHR